MLLASSALRHPLLHEQVHPLHGPLAHLVGQALDPVHAAGHGQLTPHLQHRTAHRGDRELHQLDRMLGGWLDLHYHPPMVPQQEGIHHGGIKDPLARAKGRRNVGAGCLRL